ncbi:response regulator [Candidatus Gracilibacteria bacterium]|nr:response regulator [Candidatus Gracilibacteria bacterium]NJP20989.1 response regulator [Hydrococcus sp. CRU_1_1]
MNPATNKQFSPEKTINSHNLSPGNVLEQIASSQGNGCLQVSYNSVEWEIYFNLGKLIYARHSLDPFERLERHLRRLSSEIPTLTSAVRTQVRLNFENEPQSNTSICSDYLAICWLVDEAHLISEQAAKLLKDITQEVFEPYLLLQEGAFQFKTNNDKYPKFCRFEVHPFVEECQQKLRDWQAMSPFILSPEQRPYFVSQSHAQQKLPPEKQEKLSKLLKGFSFRQLAVLTKQNELKLAQGIYPLIKDKVVILRDPQSPFDRLPKIPSADAYAIMVTEPSIVKPERKSSHKNTLSNTSFASIPPVTGAQKTYKIVCIDDSPTILKEINRFLENYDLEIHAIGDSGKALIEIIRLKPDLLLMDVGMPNIDGYQLCRLVRNHSLFAHIPIIMVTGNTGLIDRAKARIAGATDYMTKPFTQSDLVKMVFRHLT